MESIIGKMIEEREARIRAEKEEKDRKEKEIVEGLLSSLQSYLGDFWKILEERVQKTGEKYSYSVSWSNNRSSVSIEYRLPALPEYELAPIVIDWNGNPPRAGYSSSYIFNVMGSSSSSLEDALAFAREKYPVYLEEREKKALQKFWNALPDTSESNAEDIASRLFEAHSKKYPDLISQAREKYDHWKEIRGNWLRAQEENRRAREVEEAVKAYKRTIGLGYVQALAEWIEKRDFILDKNRLYASAMQEKADERRYPLGLLTYALVAEIEEDGETERYLETRSVYTASMSPDKSGFWMIDGKKDPIRFAHVVSVEKTEVAPSSGVFAKKLEKGGVEIFFAPGVSEKTIQEIAANIEELPEEPEAPEELGVSEYYKADWHRRAIDFLKARDAGEAGAEEEDNREIPF